MRLIPSIAAALFAANPAVARDIIVVSPIYAQLVALPTPANFVASHEDDRNGFYALELAPKGEKLDAWSQLITLTGSKGQAATTAVTVVAGQIGDGYKVACPDTFATRLLPPPKVRGAVAVFAGYLGCGTVDGHSEAMVFLVMQGKSEIYTVQWAERGPALTKPPEPDPAIWQLRAETLAQTRICDKVAGEQAPYPSCTQ